MINDQRMEDFFRSLEELRESQAKTDAQLAKTDAQLADTEATVKKVAMLLGNIGNNQGAVAEEFFYNSLKDTQELAGVSYDLVYHNVTGSAKGVSDEFDILMVNGKDVAIIEVKYRANQKDLQKLLTKKYENFKKLYPMYKELNHHLALASFKMDEALKEEALENNVIVLQRKGKVVETFVSPSAYA